MRFRVLGPLEVEDNGKPLDLGTPLQRRVLALLLLHGRATVTYERLAEDLWEANVPETARHTLQGYVHRLRTALGDAAGRLETRPGGYHLKVAAGELDAETFEELADSGRRALVRGDATLACRQLAEALDLWRGTPFEDLGDLTVLATERARLDALRMTTVEDQLDAELALGQHTQAIPRLEALLGEHPFRERLWGQLMIARYHAGRQAEALEAFREARDVLNGELGIQPGRWLCRLQERILLQDPALDAPEQAEPLAVEHNLPAPRDTFLGRRRELAELGGLLRTRRLVTVTGPPGVGKTRIALEVARGLHGEWTHGTFMVPLVDVEEPSLLASEIAETIGAPRASQRPVLDALVDHLRSRRMLVLLDNVEHLLAAAPQVASLLDAAPELTVLATSRAPLRLAGEQEYRLDPLPMPDRGTTSGPPGGGDAVALFAARAANADPRFELTPDTSEIIADVVTRLDGLPLAIELAAARLRSFRLADLPRHLEPALPLLVGGAVDKPRHHRTLRDAVAWSELLLDDTDRAVLRQLAVFRGGITPENAAAVIQDQGAGDVTGSLARLVEVGLLSLPTNEDPPRYRMLEIVREYAQDQLDAAGEGGAARDRHAAVHEALVAQAAPHLTQADQSHWLARLDMEHANLRAALSWTLESGDPDRARDLAAGLWRFWQLRGHLEEGRDWLTRGLALDGGSPLPRLRALIGLGGICYWQFDLDAAEAIYQRARELARDLDWWLHLEALFGLGMTLACHRGDPDEVAGFEGEFWELIGEHDDPMATGLALGSAQAMRLLAGDLEQSRRYGEMCLAGTRLVGEKWYELQVLRTLALTSLREERYELARRELQECVQIALELGDRLGLAMDLDRLGQVAVLLGSVEAGCVLAGAADRLREQVGETITPEAFRWHQDRAPVLASSTLDEVEIERATARGRALTRDDAAAMAIDPDT